MHPVRSRRTPGVGRPARAPAALSQTRLGRARRRRDMAEPAARDTRGPVRGEPRRGAGRRRRGGQPAGDDRALGPAHGHPPGQGDRLAGHPHGAARGGPPAPPRRGLLPGAVRPAALDVLLGAADPLAVRQRQGTGAARAGRRGAVRHDRELADLEPHRGRRRRPAHHRPDQRQPHHAHEHPHARLGRGTADVLRRAPSDAARHQAVRRDLRRGPHAGARPPHHGRPRRPAGRPLRPDLLHPGRGEVHVRDGQLSAAQHRLRRRAVPARTPHDRLLPDR